MVADAVPCALVMIGICIGAVADGEPCGEVFAVVCRGGDAGRGPCVGVLADGRWLGEIGGNLGGETSANV